MPDLDSIGVPVPPDFPGVEFDMFNRRLADGMPHSEDQWAQFGPSWNAVAYRFLALADADAFLAHSFKAHGTAPPMPERMRQEHALFSFVSCALSCLDSIGYAFFAACSILSPSAFPLTTEAERKKITIQHTGSALMAEYPGDRLGVLVDTVHRHPTFRSLSDWRNVAVHRSTVGRKIHLGSPDPDIMKLGAHFAGRDLVLGPALTGDYRRWLADTVTALVREGNEFLTRLGLP